MQKISKILAVNAPTKKKTLPAHNHHKYHEKNKNKLHKKTTRTTLLFVRTPLCKTPCTSLTSYYGGRNGVGGGKLKKM